MSDGADISPAELDPPITQTTQPDQDDAPVFDPCARGSDARHPLEIPFAGWKEIFWRVKDEWGADHLGLNAAGVAFYSFIAIIPGLAALVSILGLVAQGRQADEVIASLFGPLPDDARSLLTDQLDVISSQSSGSLSIGVVVGLVLSIWTASNAVGQLMYAINVAYDEDETRNWFKRRFTALGLTFGAVLFMATAIFVVVAFPVAVERSGFDIGTRRLLNILIWPVLALSLGVALGLLYRIAPNRVSARWRWVGFGAFFAILGWTAVTLAFRLYVTYLGSFNETYGSLAAVVVILVWLWLTIVLILLGAEINSEIEFQIAHDTTVSGGQPMGERGAVKADTVPTPRSPKPQRSPDETRRWWRIGRKRA